MQRKVKEWSYEISVWDGPSQLLLENVRNSLHPRDLGPVCHRCLTDNFPCLNNITRIFTFSLTHISKKYKQRYYKSLTKRTLNLIALKIIFVLGFYLLFTDVNFLAHNLCKLRYLM